MGVEGVLSNKKSRLLKDNLLGCYRDCGIYMAFGRNFSYGAKWLKIEPCYCLDAEIIKNIGLRFSSAISGSFCTISSEGNDSFTASIIKPA